MSSFKSNIKLMYLTRFLLGFNFIGGVLVPFFLEWGQISFFQLMVLESVFVFSIFLLEIPTGAIADRFSRKLSIILSSFFVITAAAIMSFYQGFYLFLIAEIFWATAFALMSGADQALIYDSLKKMDKEHQSKKILGRFGSFEITAIMIAAPIGSFIAVNIGLRYTMMFTMVPYFIALIVSLFLKEPKSEKKIESKKYLTILTNGVKYFKDHNILKILAFDTVTFSALIFLIIWVYQPLLIQLEFPLIYFGFVHALLAGVQVIFMNSFTSLENLFRSKKNYLLWSALISGIFFVILGVNTNTLLAITLIIFIGGFGLSRRTLFDNYLNKHIKSENRSTVLSTISMLEKLLRAIIYPIVGLLVEWNLNYTLMIIGTVIIILALISKVQEDHLID